MAKATLFHNARCSKSRATLELLRSRGVEVDVVDYLKDPPGVDRLAKVSQALGGVAHDLLRKKEAPYKELALGPETAAKEIFEAIHDHPILLERPIVVVGERAAIGRPPETVLELFSS